MSLFSRIFGIGNKNHQTANKKSDVKPPIGVPFFSNAPQRWGVITDGFLISNTNFVSGWESNQSDSAIQKRRFMVDSLMLLGKINNALEVINDGNKVQSSYQDGLLECKDRYATSCCIEKLFDEGILSINGIVVDNYERYAIIMVTTPTPMAYFEALRPYFVKDGYKDLIYFATHNPLGVTEDKKVKFENFNKYCFKFDPSKQSPVDRKYVEYALWWAGETEDDFLNSNVRENVDKCLDFLDFYNSYALGILSVAFGLTKDNSRTKLPDNDTATITGPEGVEILISLSQTKGINFLFPMLPQYEKYRNTFMKVYFKFCYDIRAQIEEHDLPRDEFGQPSTLIWYNQLIDKIRNSHQQVIAVYVYSKETWYDFNMN